LPLFRPALVPRALASVAALEAYLKVLAQP
jgi:hypothetical protein